MSVILSIDPGPAQSALVYFETEKPRVLSYQLVRNREAAAEVSLEAERDTELPDAPITTHLAIEVIRSSYGKPAGSELFDTAMWAGRFLGEWLARRRVDSALLIPRLDIRVHLCGPKAGDKEIRKALIDRLGPIATAGIVTHGWAALAVAVVAADRLRCGMRGKEAELGV